MKRANWPVQQEGICPAGEPDRCFYCKAKQGEEHRGECVLRQKTVVCRITIDIVRAVPEHWSPGDIEFAMNENSSCKSNLVEEIQAMNARLEAEDSCPCNLMTSTFLRDATALDEEMSVFTVESLPS